MSHTEQPGGATPQSKQKLEWKLTLTAASVYRMVTALALAVCALVLFVVHEQSRTIETQRAIIHDLFQDSIELNSLRQKQVRDHQYRQSHPAPGPQANVDGCFQHRGPCV
jgi:hypothetical protein